MPSRKYYERYYTERRYEWFKDQSCGMCGSKKNLEVDHYDPEEKSFTITWTESKKRLEEELEKCWALCHDCHKKKTASEQRRAKHRTITMYKKYECRCPKCQQAHSDFQQAYRARRKTIDTSI